MSVIMTLQMAGDPAGAERYAAENKDAMRAIVESATSHGLIAHRFYGSEGQILVVDEWPDEQSCQEFFAQTQPQIQRIMEAAGVTEEPHPTFWHKLEMHDDVGWE